MNTDYNKWQRVEKSLEDDEEDAAPVLGHAHAHPDGASYSHDHQAPGFGKGPQKHDFQDLQPEPPFALSKKNIDDMKKISTKSGTLRKSVIKSVESSSKPKEGDFVVCKYTGRLLNGAFFDSSEDGGVKFKVGLKPKPNSPGLAAIEGWNQAVVTMAVGEVARFYISADLAYGESGKAPYIHPDASLQFQIELIAFSEYDSVPGTANKVRYKELAEGRGWKSPKDHDVCFLRMSIWQFNNGKDGPMVKTVGGGCAVTQPAAEENHEEFVCNSMSVRLDAIGGRGTIVGIEHALGHMKPGAKWEIIIHPDMAYGKWGLEAPQSGAVPAVPAHSTLKARLELVEFMEVVDVTEEHDGGVVKMEETEGAGWEQPTWNDLLEIRYQIKLVTQGEKDLVLKAECWGDNSSCCRYSLGSGMAGLSSLAGKKVEEYGGKWGMDWGLLSMKKGEVAELTIRAAYAFGEEGGRIDNQHTVPGGATLKVNVELLGWLRVSDLLGDGGVMMTEEVESAKEGDFNKPDVTANTTVQLHVREGDVTLIQPETLTLTVMREEEGEEEGGNDQATEEKKKTEIEMTIEGHGLGLDEDQSLAGLPVAFTSKVIEAALFTMKKGGRCSLRVKANRIDSFPPTDIVLDLHLVHFENDKSVFDMTEAGERMAAAAAKKARGNHWFRLGQLERAMRRYEAAKKYLDGEGGDGMGAADVIQTRVAIYNNLVLCQTKLGLDAEVMRNCNEALHLDPCNVKALYRRGALRSKLLDFAQARADLHKVLEIDSENKLARKELLLLKKRAAKQVDKEKKKYAGMFK